MSSFFEKRRGGHGTGNNAVHGVSAFFRNGAWAIGLCVSAVSDSRR